MTEREITEPVALCLPGGGLNREAVGWSRTALHDTSGIGRGFRDRGRNKRWEYWAILSPTHIVSLTVSSLDFAGVHGFWVHDRRTGETVDRGAVGGPWTATLPGSLGGGGARARMRGLELSFVEEPGGTRLRARARGLAVDVLAARPEPHELVAVVVPWSERRFQYTVKDVVRTASGTVTVDGVTTELGEAWAILDHGRGRWHHSVRWNWGAAVGRTDGHLVGLQFGARWTDGTGMTENGFVVDGRTHKVSEQLEWVYDLERPMDPWTIRGTDIEVTLTPEYDHATRTDLGPLGTRGDQVFGVFDGWIRVGGERIRIERLFGFAEDVANRW
ncbi:DUF2804 domain-containing protein [Protaetiibacter intestinalis]|uniref:DUF2804 domain-containing protein n=1 Tax=Protaetiibacter intestinalis TaxID=2419774 RepID=A0A387B8V4_9MICO|nr:DUF2804 domain-containing protein [Protaetiibacter intestinalis]AYF97615.1 DUF2804 domain-containing protein [Protaetiibacter intestinalis]